MELNQVVALFGSIKHLGGLISRSHRSFERWRETGIPLMQATAISGALRLRAQRCISAADAMDTAVLKAKADGRKTIKEF